MNVVKGVGSFISQGVYSVATPFHPFGGAVDVIVVEQQDGSYRSTPWYVRFGKFQGVLKGAEKVVRISVNGVEASFHMYLDNSGEAYFVREVVSGKDEDSVNEVNKVYNSEAQQGNVGEKKDGGNDDSSVTILRNESDVSTIDKVQLLDDPALSSTDQVENSDVDDERRLFNFEDQQPSRANSVESVEYRAYYERLDQEEDVADSQGSDSEVVLFSVDGHVLTAPISSAVENADNLQLCTPQFHLGPGEEADLVGNNEELSSSKETWTADFGDIDSSLIDNTSQNYSNAFEEGSESNKSDMKIKEGSESNRSDMEIRGSSESNNNSDMEVVIQGKETYASDSIKKHSNEHDSPTDDMNKEDVFGSCLELTSLQGHTNDVKPHYTDSLHTDVGAKENIGELEENSPSCIPSVEENKDEVVIGFQNSAISSSHNFDSPHMLPLLGVKAEASEGITLNTDNSACQVSDSVSSQSVSKDPDWKDEHSDMLTETHRVASPGRSDRGQEYSRIEPVESQSENSDAGTRSNMGMGFEISLCGHLLHTGMGLGPASEVFDAFLISEEVFKLSASSIIKEENLIIRFKGKYFPWAKAAHLVLGMAAFGLDLLAETKDAILVELNETPKPREDSPEFTSTPSGRRWRLWPIAFRRVKTIEHTNSTSSAEELFVDSDSGSQNPRTESSPSLSAGNRSPHKKLVRTNIPSTDQIASLNLKDGQNMITFSFSTRVLGTQQVDAHIYLWKWNARIVISDVDGTITKSDVLGQFMPLVGKDWTQSGVTRLFSAIKENGYQLLFLSARAIVQAYLTRSFLLNIKQDGKTLPNGPVVISPDGLFPSLFREVIRRAPHEFKIACLEDIKALFPSDYNPFYAGFGNRDTDELSYRKIGIPKGKIFIINPKGEVAISHRSGVKSYTSLHTLVNDMFPPTSMVEQEDFNAWNYWKMPLPNIDL